MKIYSDRGGCKALVNNTLRDIVLEPNSIMFYYQFKIFPSSLTFLLPRRVV